jgi:hypothetical protein
MKDEEGNLIYGKTGQFFQERGDWLVKKFEGLGMNHNSADMAKMVFFSFADGSLIAPFVKLFEDRREKIGRAIDRTIGQEADAAVYAAEPKQGWLSVLGGRLATVSIVVPTAVLLDRLGLNDKLFKNPGLKVGQWIESKPELAKHFGNLDIPEVSKIGFFEFFYTSVCTFGLYVSSRFFARMGARGKEEPTPPATTTAPLNPTAHDGQRPSAFELLTKGTAAEHTRSAHLAAAPLDEATTAQRLGNKEINPAIFTPEAKTHGQGI